MFAALGELVSQRAGVLNIGLEGMMLMGAYAGFVAAYHGGSEWLGFGAGLLAGAAVSLLMVLFCVRWGLDQIVTGIAITLTCEGATGLIFEAEFAESRPTLGATDKVAIPGLVRPACSGRQGRVEREHLHAAARRLPRPRARGAGRLDPAPHAHGSQRPGGR